MKELKILENYTGVRWTGIRLSEAPGIKRIGRPMRLCEAVSKSFDMNIVLDSNSIDCPRRTS